MPRNATFILQYRREVPDQHSFYRHSIRCQGQWAGYGEAPAHPLLDKFMLKRSDIGENAKQQIAAGLEGPWPSLAIPLLAIKATQAQLPINFGHGDAIGPWGSHSRLIAAVSDPRPQPPFLANKLDHRIVNSVIVELARAHERRPNKEGSASRQTSA